MTAADMRTTDRAGRSGESKVGRTDKDPPSKKWVPDIIMMGHF